MPRIVFAPASSGPHASMLVVSVSPVESLLVALMREGAPIRHDCGGKALCGTCRLRVCSGASGLSPMGERERARLASFGAALDGSERLACQARAARDATLEALVPLVEGEGR